MPAPDDGASDRPGIFENSALNVGALALASAVGAISGIITVRTLGKESYGVLAVVFGLIEIGRGLTNFTHNPSILAVHRGENEGTVFGTSLVLKYAGAILCLALAFVLAPWLGPVFHVPAWAIILTSSILLVGAFQEIGTARYEAANRMLARNVFVTLGPVAGLAAVIVFLVAGEYNVLTAIVTSLVGTAVMSVAFYVHWRPRKLRWDGGVQRYLIVYGSRLIAASFLTQALLWTDTLVISHLLGNERAGLYHIVFQLSYVMVTVSVAIGVAVLPAMSELVGRGHDTSAAYQRGTLIALLMSAGIAIFYLIAGPFILTFFYGLAPFEGYLPLAILVVFGLAASLLVPAVSLLTVHHRAGTLTIVSLAQAIINVGLCYALTLRYGIAGAAAATTIVFVLGLIVTWWLAWRITGALPLSRAALREGWEHAAARLRKLGAKN